MFPRKSQGLNSNDHPVAGTRSSVTPIRLERLTVFDVLLVVLLVALPVWALVRRHTAPRTGLTVEVRQDNKLTGVYPLGRDAVVQVTKGLKVEIRAGRVRVAESDCPRHICCRAGWRATPGSTVACVPNRVVITIAGPDEQYDAETW